MREFNTSGPNIPQQHYTIQRTNLIKKGVELIEKSRYFTIWAPRQTGKSTYFRQLAEELNNQGYYPVYFSVEGFNDFSAADTFDTFCTDLKTQQNINWHIETFKEFEQQIKACKDKKMVIIIDEIESLNPEIFGQFLHTIRNLYHIRQEHCLKSVILVGVSNIIGVVSDNASPFNIADNLNVPYFTNEEVYALLGQHETETGQLFDDKVKHKISEITANQPGLVNGFAKVLVENNPEKEIIDYEDYLKVEHWYLNKTIDKNISNILNKANEERVFVERLLFTEEKIPFKINKPHIKHLYTNGLIKEDDNGYVTFWVPLYKKTVYDAFYPYTNGEKSDILRRFVTRELFDNQGKMIFDNIIKGYKEYVKRRSLKVFLNKDENGNYKSINESALIYSFETYIQAFLQVVEGKSYREADTGLGKSDLIINVNSEELLIETKIYYYEAQFLKGKKQLAYYCESLGLNEGIYIVFCPKGVPYPETIKEQSEKINNTKITTYLIEYDDKKW